jgi:hypothetical protein
VIVEFFAGQNNPFSFLWLILRVLNLLLGILYFALFGLNRKHANALKARYPIIQGVLFIPSHYSLVHVSRNSLMMLNVFLFYNPYRNVH